MNLFRVSSFEIYIIVDKQQKQIEELNKQIEQLNKEITELKKQIEELTNNWKRALADYQNLEKRQKEEKAQYTIYIISEFLVKILPVLDLFEKAGEHIKDEGLNLALHELQKVFTVWGIEEINRVNIPFDPHLHEAVETKIGEKEGEVLEIFTKGYKYKNYLIRPAKVKVSLAGKV